MEWERAQSVELGSQEDGLVVLNVTSDQGDSTPKLGLSFPSADVLRFQFSPLGDVAFEAGAADYSIEAVSYTHLDVYKRQGLVINADSEHKDAAATWITWLASSPAAAEIRIEAGWDLPAVSDEDTLASYLDMTPPDNRQAVFDSLDYLVVPPVIEMCIRDRSNPGIGPEHRPRQR